MPVCLCACLSVFLNFCLSASLPPVYIPVCLCLSTCLSFPLLFKTYKKLGQRQSLGGRSFSPLQTSSRSKLTILPLLSTNKSQHHEEWKEIDGLHVLETKSSSKNIFYIFFLFLNRCSEQNCDGLTEIQQQVTWKTNRIKLPLGLVTLVSSKLDRLCLGIIYSHVQCVWVGQEPARV